MLHCCTFFSVWSNFNIFDFRKARGLLMNSDQPANQKVKKMFFLNFFDIREAAKKFSLSAHEIQAFTPPLEPKNGRRKKKMARQLKKKKKKTCLPL